MNFCTQMSDSVGDSVEKGKIYRMSKPLEKKKPFETINSFQIISTHFRMVTKNLKTTERIQRNLQ